MEEIAATAVGREMVVLCPFLSFIVSFIFFGVGSMDCVGATVGTGIGDVGIDEIDKGVEESD